MLNDNDSTSKKILFVDDEVQILKSLNRLFMDTEYEVFTAGSGKEALDILATEKIDMIITDMRMPEMDGSQLLHQVKELYPNSLRIILSGYAEKNTVLQALQKNIAKLYILKPWENDKLIELVDQLFETENILRDSNLLGLINKVDELPTIKSSYRQIMELIDQDADLAKIASAIEKDHSIATKILHIINSAFYEVKTGSVKHAITYLGLSTIRNILLTTSIVDSLNMNGLYGTRLELLWNHSFICSKIVNIIYEKLLLKKLSENEISAGLLHNIGIVLLLKLFPEKYIEVFHKEEREKTSLLQIEQEALNVTHQQTGGYLLRWWELPHPIVEAALYHHTPFATGIIHRELIYAVNIAQHYASIILKNQLPSTTFDAAVFAALGIDQNQFEKEISHLSLNKK
ncbi:HDOD domain-containing protein [Pelosinus sp. sgz500959]|uniref:HDOD domain-containing protein n=1 Tax=Pelosinus sp. sgz500959 TaxID=3242472 RepID=UPI00366E8870